METKVKAGSVVSFTTTQNLIFQNATATISTPGLSGINFVHCRKNLLQCVAATNTNAARTISSNGDDGVVSYNLKQNASITSLLTSAVIPSFYPYRTIPAGTYTVRLTWSSTPTMSGIKYEFVSGGSTIVVNDSVPVTFTQSASLNRVYGSTKTFTNGTTLMFAVQIEVGETATDFEAFNGTITSISFPAAAGTVDAGVLDVTNGKLTVTSGTNPGTYSVTATATPFFQNFNNYFSDGGGDTSITYVESKPLVYQNNFEEYLKALKKPFEKVVRLDFLQEDEKGVAFSVGNVVANGYMTDHPTNAFIQSGSLNVNLQNGTRRTCTVKFGNADGKFRYAVDNLWYGTKIRLMMGLVLPDGTPFYIPQGVFLIKEPLTEWRPSERTVTFTLVDKFALLDGTLGGRLSYAHQVNSPINNRPNVFDVVQAFLHFDKFTLIDGNVPLRYIDPITPKFTDYYNGVTVTQTYSSGATETVPFTAVTYDLTLANGSTIANGIAELNSLLACWYGYDASGSFTMDASQDDFSDKGKPTLWDFTPDNSDFLAFSETAKNTELYNNVVICGQGSTYATYYGRAYNVDPASESNIYKIGLKTYWQNESNLCSEKQCKDLAAFLLKQKAFLSKSNSISCGQMFHLRENALVTVRRDDLAGAPTKRYLITSYSLPIEDGGQMQINCSEVDDSEGVKIKTEGGIG